MYEHKFIKLELSSLRRKPENDYHEVVHEQAKDGWELVQIFAPGSSSYGIPSYYELIFKRQKETS
ncbi:DUF4177 domain-containing protein [Halobacillus sp. ACCC02827]|uniref:DUF4177 domain-containing protein n=1 Tax=Bacillaceae TaxID=186817 RepID=UPI0002A4CFD5|nr:MULTISPECIES: DUF4177 domain-containing protein [Bacillaceae]ELK45628.1 hypothetical protein D479_13842 [Halobacillus sp. BAB-2008]QHT46157.1 DUF4177 domain-containing protein [Bacillus sp. SB49]WJE16971.1 DUF4177 domain-containing protein [Halobacillus sp. ACCC02827]